MNIPEDRARSSWRKRSRRRWRVSDIAVDATGDKGHYFVLMGHLSPLDGLGPQELGLPMLEERLARDRFQEIIIATNLTVDGGATAHFLADMAARHQVPARWIAHGVPLGAELEAVRCPTHSSAAAWSISRSAACR